MIARRPLAAGLACVLLLPLVGCGGGAGRRSLDEARARQAGSYAAQITEAELGRVALPALDAYLDALVAGLAAALPEAEVEWRTGVLDSATPLVVGFEGGHLLVSRGMLVDVSDEAALQRALAVEMVHVARGDAQRRLEALAALPPKAAPGVAAGLVLPGLGRPLGSVATLEDALLAVPYAPEAVAAAAPRVEALLSAAAPVALEGEGFPRALAGLAVGHDPRQGIVEGRRLLHHGLDLSVAFPEGWRIVNAADAVVAFDDAGDARVVLQLVAEDDDPVAPARAFAQGGAARFGLLPRGREIGGRSAARAWGSTGDASLDVTWIVHEGDVYQISGVCGPDDYEALQVAFIDVALSLRALDDRDPSRFEPTLLHVEPAPSGAGWIRVPRRAPLQTEAPPS